MTTLKRSLTALWKATGLQDVRLHDLRRTHATKLIQLNVDPRTVAGRLGHSGTAMLARHYAVHLGDIEAARTFSARTAKTEHGQRGEGAVVETFNSSPAKSEMAKGGKGPSRLERRAR